MDNVTNLSVSLKDKILASSDVATELVQVPEWGVELEVRGLSAGQWTRITNASVRKVAGEVTPDLSRLYSLLIVAGVFDPKTGEQVFTESDAVAVMNKSMKPIERLAKTVNRLSGITDDDDSDVSPLERAIGLSGKDS